MAALESPSPLRATPRPDRAVTPGDRRLALRLAQGDPEALRLLQTEHTPAVERYLQHVLRDHAAAEDVLQQVMLQAWQRGGSFDPDRGSVMTWLMTIARSRAIDYLRRSVPEPHDPHKTVELVDRGSALDDETDALAERWRVAAMLARLPPEQAELLRLRFHLGMSQSAIAEATGVPLGTVKMRMVAALKRLRELIDEEPHR